MEDQLQTWRAEWAREPKGWDFSHLWGRMREDFEPWDQSDLYRELIPGADCVLDMGTGGGEFISDFVPLAPGKFTATEGWEPNIPTAKQRLAPLGVAVVEFAAPDLDPCSVPMPFADESFDLILNRHESYCATEVARVLRPGGAFVTQQVGSDDFVDLSSHFGPIAPMPEVTLGRFQKDLEDAGLVVEQGLEHFGRYEFADAAALVAYLRMVPWHVPEDFSPDKYAEQLFALEAPIRALRSRFRILARKPGGETRG